MSAELTYDLMLEVTGVLRSIPVRTKLDSNLRVGETFDLRGRRWIVSSVDQIGGDSERQTRLARATGADQRDHRVPVEEHADLLEVVLATAQDVAEAR